jgi:hypothetical protein|tara:strand:+ start:454 stop:642 length:189 start_codon:yes stop_codon:yes gene_type:complete
MEETATVGRQHRFYALRSVAKTTGWTTGWVLFYISSNVREKDWVKREIVRTFLFAIVSHLGM